MKPRRICIVSHAAYGAMIGSGGHIGGVEHQTSLLAKWLARRGHAVDLVVWREVDDPQEIVAGVRLLPICRRADGLPGLRFLTPRWTSLVRALRTSNADVYYHNTAEYVTGQVALWCKRARRRFVFSAASQADCDRALPLLPTRRERVLYRLGLRYADAVVVQTQTQQRMMQESFARPSLVIPMPCPEPADDMIVRPGDATHSRRVLWVGRMSPEKRPELLIAAAAAAPDLQFDLVGPVDGTGFGERIVGLAKQHSNITYHGAIARAGMAAIYRRSRVLLCTSAIEGFPNTFLEAWSQGIPVVSTWDPDSLIATRQLGRAVADAPAALVDGIRQMLHASTWNAASLRAREYYVATHRPDATFSQFETVLSGPSQLDLTPRPNVLQAC